MRGAVTSELKKRKKKGVDIYSDLYYHLFLSFEWRLNNSLGGGKSMCIVRWEVIKGVFIGSIATCGEVCMSRR